MKRFWLVAVVGAAGVAHRSVWRVERLRRVELGERPAAGNPIKLGVLTSLTGPFTPWGIQTRAGMALAVNEINRTGGVKGKGQRRQLNLAVADDQSTNTNAAIDGFRRLTAAGGRRRRSAA